MPDFVDFIFTLIGCTYHLVNPIIYSYFNKSFRVAMKEYVNEEILCLRTKEKPCCPGHDTSTSQNHQGVYALINQIGRPKIPSAKSDDALEEFRVEMPMVNYVVKNKSSKMNGVRPSSVMATTRHHHLNNPEEHYWGKMIS